MKTGLYFDWKSGTRNSAAIETLKSKKINFEFDHFGRIKADLYRIGVLFPIEFEHITDDLFEIIIEK